MQFDRLSFGLPVVNGSAMAFASYNINFNYCIRSNAFKSPASSISSIRFVGNSSGTLTNSAWKCYILEGIVGNLFQIATISTSNDTFTLVNYHNISVNDRVVILGETMPAGITNGGVYWVVNVSTNDIKISTTQGGTAIDLTTTGTNVAVAKYVDHSELTTVTTIESTRKWYDFAGFSGASLSDDKIYYYMPLNLETASSSNYITFYGLGSSTLDTWNLRINSNSLSSITRSYTSYLLQHKITYVNGDVDDFLFGYSAGNSNSSLNASTVKYGNYYKNNTDTKLYIRNIIANGIFNFANATSKDLSFVCKIYDKTTKNVLATSNALKPYNFATSTNTNQYFYFEFATAYEWAKDAEIYVMIEYNSGTVDSSNYLQVYYIPWNATYYNGVNALFKRRGRTAPLLFQNAVQYASSTWTEQTGANAKMYFLDMQFDTYNPTASVSGGAALIEPSNIF